MPRDAKLYLDYLNKEGDVMGLLAGFCVALGAFAIERTAGASQGFLRDLWFLSAHWILAGAFAALCAALLFYRQRSHLLWLYGQISLVSCDPDEFTGPKSEWRSLSAVLKAADAWTSWILYRWGFGFLMVAFLEFGTALLAAAHPTWLGGTAWAATWPFVPMILFLTFTTVVLHAHKDESNPFKEALGIRRKD